MSQASFNDNAISVVKAIQDGVQTTIIEVDGQEFTTRPVYLTPEKKDVSAIYISTLDGLIEYLTENVDNHNFTNLVVIVDNSRSVSVYAQIDDRKDSRVLWLNAAYDVDGFPFGRYQNNENFMVTAQSLITDSFDRPDLLKFIGNMTAAVVQTSTDDGTSQTVTVESGVRKSNVELPNPVKLSPRRTFPEVDQPTSEFVLRLTQVRDGQMPEIGLFEADGGFWKVQAIHNIKTYISKKLKEAELDIPVIG